MHGWSAPNRPTTECGEPDLCEGHRYVEMRDLARQDRAKCDYGTTGIRPGRGYQTVLQQFRAVSVAPLLDLDPEPSLLSPTSG